MSFILRFVWSEHSLKLQIIKIHQLSYYKIYDTIIIFHKIQKTRRLKSFRFFDDLRHVPFANLQMHQN